MTSLDLAQFRENELYLARQLTRHRTQYWIHPKEEPDPLGLSSAWDNVPEPKRVLVLWWIRDRIVPCSQSQVSSAYGKYSLKFEWERWAHANIGFYYISEGQFKGAMVELGYLPVDPGEQSWRFMAKERLPYAERSKLTTRGALAGAPVEVYLRPEARWLWCPHR